MRRFYGPGPVAARDRPPLPRPAPTLLVAALRVAAVPALKALWGLAADAITLEVRFTLRGRQRRPWRLLDRPRVRAASRDRPAPPRRSPRPGAPAIARKPSGR
ncbi:hypothetical protein AB0M72_18355 [Nocardiopsis dassonvillei]